MNEHDDDLESVVREGADEETDAFPDTADDLDDTEPADDAAGDEDVPDLDRDPAEI